MKNLFLIFLISFLLASIQDKFYAQEVSSPHNISIDLSQNIESQMASKYGKKFYLSRFFILDSLINKVPYSFVFPEIKDPYGKLTGTAIFSCQLARDDKPDSLMNIPDSSIIGFIKGGVILWDSGPIIYGDVANYLSFCEDINKDGVVDVGIISEYFNYEYFNPNLTVNYLWIISWDGSEGTIINEYDNITGKSTLIPGPFKLFDWEGDGIYEISSQWYFNDDYDFSLPENPPVNYPYITYGWNGNQYGYWTSIYQLKEGDFYPAVWIEPSIKCKVSAYNNLLRFDYTITNGINAKQKIEDIFITRTSTSSIDENSEYENNIVSTPTGLIDNTWLFTAHSYSGLVEPGETQTTYWYQGSGLPGLCYAYIRGLIPVELTRDGTRESTIESVYNNSVKVATIGLKGKLNENSFGNLDSLFNYIDSSYKFGWIKNQQTFDKYESYLNTAKTALEQNQISQVRTALESIVQEVDIDSTSNITSEAYALLKFNTEYLLENLPEEAPGLVVKLVNSNNELLTTGTLKYYEGGWKDAVDNGDGTFTVNTEQNSVSLRMNYEYSSQTISNVSVTSDTFAFQTVNTKVQLLDSQDNPITEEANVKYYSGGWRDFGTTVNGVAEKELLPNNYSFRMNYAFASNDKKQDTEVDPVVVFQTVNTQVELQDSEGNPITEEATVKYYSGGWRNFGTTINGVAEKELLPNNYSFRMNYAYASNDKKQDTEVNPVVVFQTVNTQVQLQNSQGNPITEGATVKYYSGGWRDFGTTVNGVAEKELLPNNYSFRMNYAFISKDKKQDVGVDNIVTFSTVLCTVNVKDNQSQPIDNAVVKYYAGGWRDFGNTVNGIVTKELLPANISFRATYNSVQEQKKQDISSNSTVEFILNTTE